MDIIDDAVKPDQIETLEKQLDKVEIKTVCHGIDDILLITLLK